MPFRHDRFSCTQKQVPGISHGYELLKKKYGFFQVAENSYTMMDNFTNSVLSSISQN